jgi:acyl-CoA synthetase (AMP-forming)/AMP-acid ligase II
MVMTFWDLIADAAARHPDRVLFANTDGHQLTSVGLCDAAERVAAGLVLTAEDIVSWQLPTVLESVVLMAALARVGALQNPIIPLLREREVGLITRQLHTTKIVVPTSWRGFDYQAMADRVARDAGFEVIAVELEQRPRQQLRLPLGDVGILPPPPSNDHAWRWAYYTSGSTAAPKGVRHTDASVIASSWGITERLEIHDGDVYPVAWPLTHIGGATMMAAVLRAGGRLVLFDTFDPGVIGENMAKLNPTILGTAVPFFRAYLEAQRRHEDTPLYPNLRAFTAGGAPTPAELLHELEQAFAGKPVVNSWGLTEFPVAASAAPSDPAHRLATTVGRAAPGVRVRVVDGELRLKGPQRFVGYVDPALDTDAFDETGWFRTGDLGVIDDDGYITITGRLKDVIIRNGENVSALEVEEVLLRHPDIADASVLGLPDTRTGERICAVIVPAAHRRVTMDMVIEHCASEYLARQKMPEQIAIVDAIERNPMGKVVKSELRSWVLANAVIGTV